MIYLVGPYPKASRWVSDHRSEVEADPRGSCHIPTVSAALDLRPGDKDEIVLLGGATSEHIRARDYLIHAQELQRRRREISMRQAP